jgi:hypothetical protein
MKEAFEQKQFPFDAAGWTMWVSLVVVPFLIGFWVWSKSRAKPVKRKVLDDSESADSGSTVAATAADHPFSELLFRFSSPGERFLMAMGLVFAAVSGVVQPMMCVIMGSIADDFGAYQIGAMDETAFQNSANDKVLQLVYLAIVIFGARSNIFYLGPK